MSYELPQEVQGLVAPFDPDYGLDTSQMRPFPKGYLRNKMEERSSMYGFKIPEHPVKDVNTISAEVGDDGISVSDNIAFTALLPVFHNELGMKISEEDTSISKRFGNFTEELLILPDSYYQTYHHARNVSDFRDMSYMDTCKIRLATDIRPMRMTHSSTNDGKASMVGRRQAWIPPGRLRTRYDVFSLYQDIHLGLKRDQKFAYLPESLGGYGKRVPFEEPDNMERFIKSFRQGSHARLVRSIIRKVTSWYHDFRNGNNPGPDPLLAFVSRFTSGFHDWVKGHSIYAPVSWIGVPPEVAKYRVNLSTRVPLERDVISRLLAEDYLIPESKVQIVHEHNEFCQGLLGGTNVLKTRELISAKRKEWLKNSSVFSLEAYGYIKEITLLNEGSRPLIRIEAQSFKKVIDDQSLFNLKVQLRDEPVYDRRILDDLYARGPMKATFHMYPKYKGHMLNAHQNLRSYVIDTEELGEIERLQTWLDEGAKGTPPRRLLNDDSSIIQEINDSLVTIHAIVTDDVRLCKLANRKTGKPVYRVPCEWYTRNLYFGEGGEPWADYLRTRTGYECETHLDDGSFRSFEENFFKDGMLLKQKARQRFSLVREERNATEVVFQESEVFDSSPPDARPETFLYDYRNQLRVQRSKNVA